MSHSAGFCENTGSSPEIHSVSPASTAHRLDLLTRGSRCEVTAHERQSRVRTFECQRWGAQEGGCQVERRCEESDSGTDTGAPTEQLDICFTISHCCKTEQETGREGVKSRGDQSSIWFSTLRRATSSSVTLHLHRTIRLAKVHKKDGIPCHLPPDLFSRVTRLREERRNNDEGARSTWKWGRGMRWAAFPSLAPLWHNALCQTVNVTLE